MNAKLSGWMPRAKDRYAASERIDKKDGKI